MNFRTFFKTLYTHTIGCCCGSGQLYTRNEERRPLLVEVAVDALEYPAFLNEQVLVNVPRVIEHGDSESDDTEHPSTSKHTKIEDSKQGKTEPGNTDPENTETVDPKPKAKTEPQALPIQDPEPHPELELKLDDSTRKIEMDNFFPGDFKAKVEGKMIQERFALSELEYGNEGSFGQVWTAHDQANPQVKFAVKVVKKIFYDKPDSWYKDTEGELKVLLKVKHENIVRLLDYFWIKRPNIAEPLCLALKTEHLDFDLENVLQEVDAPLPLEIAKIVAKQLGPALNHLHHECKIAHHDFKAQNVMMTPFKSVEDETRDKLIEYLSSCDFKMIDLGFGQQYSDEVADCIEADFRKGTKKYRSLEKLEKPSYNPFLADCFAFAVAPLLEIMMGYNEFEAEYIAKRDEIWDKETKRIKRPTYNFVLAIAKEFFKYLENLEPIQQLVLDLLADEPDRWFMDQAMKVIDKL